jgi:hypothetical protein
MVRIYAPAVTSAGVIRSMLARIVSTDMLLTRTADHVTLRIALWVAQAGLVLAFECLGILKSCMPVAELQGELHLFTDVPHSILPLVGGIETAGAALLLLPSTLRILPALTPLAACGLAASALLGAIVPGTGAALALPLPNLVFAGLAAFVAWGRARRGSIEVCYLQNFNPGVNDEPDDTPPTRPRNRKPIVPPWANSSDFGRMQFEGGRP